LGVCKEFGIGTEQDFEYAEILYGQSCYKKNETAKFLLQRRGERASGRHAMACL